MTNPSAQTMLADANRKDAEDFCKGAFGPFVTDVSQYVEIVTKLLQHASDRAASAPAAVRDHIIKDISDDKLFNIATEAWSATVDSPWSTDGLESAVLAVRSAVEEAPALAAPEEASTAAGEAKPFAKMTPTEKAAYAIERFRQNRMTTFTPTNILDDFGDIILAALYATQTDGVRDELITALQFIVDGYDNHDINHVDYRVKVYQVALDALAAASPSPQVNPEVRS